MTRACQITGKRPRSGNKVSHSQRHTKRTFTPNVKKKKIMIDGKLVKMKLSMRALRTLEKKGMLK
jgi:large subunit ribosomal protein L28